MKRSCARESLAPPAYIIESGRVEILVEKPDGRMQCVGTRGSETMIGEMAMVDDAPRTATVRAIEDCTLLELTKDDFCGRLRQADPVLRMTAQVILNRYRDMLARAEITGPEPAVPAEAIEVSNAERKQVIECVRLNNEFRDALPGRRSRALLSADRQPADRRDPGLRGPDALAPSGARLDRASALHSHGGEQRTHRRGKRVGTTASVRRAQTSGGPRPAARTCS